LEGPYKSKFKIFYYNYLLSLDDYITGDLSFGTPPQKFNVMLASGGTRAWVINATYDRMTPNSKYYSPG
jgi:hypothetical protein